MAFPVTRAIRVISGNNPAGRNSVSKSPKKRFDNKDPFNDSSNSTQSTKSVSNYKPDFSYTNTRGTFVMKDDEDRYLNFQFNPEEVVDTKETTYEDRVKTGFDNADSIWVSGGPRIITFTLILDATESSRVRHLGKSGNSSPTGSDLDTHDPDMGTLKQVEFLQSLQRPFTPSTEKPRFIRNGAVPAEQFAAPPEIIFVYGKIYVEGHIADMEVTHKRFNRDLTPLHSEVSITLRVLEGRTININPNVTKLAGVANI